MAPFFLHHFLALVEVSDDKGLTVVLPRFLRCSGVMFKIFLFHLFAEVVSANYRELVLTRLLLGPVSCADVGLFSNLFAHLFGANTDFGLYL